MEILKESIRTLAKRFGYTIKKDIYPDVDKDFFAIQKQIAPYTLTGFESQLAMYTATQHIAKHRIEGDIVECGVWKGGISMLMASVLQKHHSEKKIYLYDTFEGMTEPTDVDVRFDGAQAKTRWFERRRDDGTNAWTYASIEEVTENMNRIGYKQVTYIKGKVEETIPAHIPERISLLRLDTDWYESTKHELVHLFPRLVSGGVLVIDDYGQWLGSGKAVDEYFAENNIVMYLHRLDHGARIGIKL